MTEDQDAPEHDDPRTLASEPADLGDGGRLLWAEVLDRYTLGPHELALLARAARMVDRTDELQAALDRDGLMTTTAKGDPRLHPAAAELRFVEQGLRQTLAGLRLPDVDPASRATGPRPQHRGGARGSYLPGGARGVTLPTGPGTGRRGTT